MNSMCVWPSSPEYRRAISIRAEGTQKGDAHARVPLSCGSPPGLAAREAVAHPKDRFDAALAARRKRPVLANVADLGLQQVRVALVIVAPRVFDQTAVRDDATFVQRQHVQDAELQPRQLDRVACLGHLVRL